MNGTESLHGLVRHPVAALGLCAAPAVPPTSLGHVVTIPPTRETSASGGPSLAPVPVSNSSLKPPASFSWCCVECCDSRGCCDGCSGFNTTASATFASPPATCVFSAGLASSVAGDKAAVSLDEVAARVGSRFLIDDGSLFCIAFPILFVADPRQRVPYPAAKQPSAPARITVAWVGETLPPQLVDVFPMRLGSASQTSGRCCLRCLGRSGTVCARCASRDRLGTRDLPRVMDGAAAPPFRIERTRRLH